MAKGDQAWKKRPGLGISATPKWLSFLVAFICCQHVVTADESNAECSPKFANPDCFECTVGSDPLTTPVDPAWLSNISWTKIDRWRVTNEGSWARPIPRIAGWGSMWYPEPDAVQYVLNDYGSLIGGIYGYRAGEWVGYTVMHSPVTKSAAIHQQLLNIIAGYASGPNGYRAPAGSTLTDIQRMFPNGCADFPQSPDNPAAYHGTDPDPGGRICPLNLQGDPINIFNGNMVERTTDVELASPFQGGLRFSRTYNSRQDTTGVLGSGWSHSFSAALVRDTASATLTVTDETGRAVAFEDRGNGIFQPLLNERSTLEPAGSGFLWRRLDGSSFLFGANGRLEEIRDQAGNSLSLGYDPEGRLATVSDPASGRALHFHYNGAGLLESVSDQAGTTRVSYGYATTNLTTVTYGDGSGFTYEYEDPYDAHNITAKRDSLGHFLAGWSYDGEDRAVYNETRDDRGVSIDYETYAATNQVLVADAYEKRRFYTIDSPKGAKKRITATSGDDGCTSCGLQVVRIAYNGDRRIEEIEYANGRIDRFENFDARGNARTEIQNYGTPEARTLTYSFHPASDRLLSRAEPSLLGPGQKETIWDFDDDSNELPNENPTSLVHRVIERGFTRDADAAVVPYEEVTVYRYNPKGQLTEIDGPLPGSLDTTVSAYDPTTGDLVSVSLPLVGAITLDDFDPAGNPRLATDRNQQQTTLAYDLRNRLLSSTTNGITTSRSLNRAGDLETATDGADRTLTYSYDPFYGRLATITDALGSTLLFGYDLQGNRTEESALDPAGTRRWHRRFDFQHPSQPGKLWKIISPDDTATVFDYDEMGSVGAVTDNLERTTATHYDPWMRPEQTVQPGEVTTAYEYDAHGNLSAVTDAEQHTTTYQHDDRGRLLEVVSPDTGTTTFAYQADATGETVRRTDGRGIASALRFDLLGRMLDASYPNPATGSSFVYDQGENGMGRLTTVTEPSGSTVLRYDGMGRLATEEKTIAGRRFTVGYHYDGSGLLETLTYPSGRTVTYHRDPAGALAGMNTTLDGVTTSLATNGSSKPFGPLAALALGNGATLGIEHDELYRTTAISAGPATFGFQRDAVGNLKAATGIERPTLPPASSDYDYNPGSNQLVARTGRLDAFYRVDAGGNIVSDGSRTFVYDDAGRMAEVRQGQTVLATYTYDGANRRTVKTTAGGTTTLYIYDTNGLLLAEADGSGTVQREYVYLDGTPFALVRYGNQAGIYWYVTDHLGTPQQLLDATGATVWKAAYLPFGEAQILEETVVNNLRFPGQYFDGETGLHYNWHRSYEAGTGRYLTPDPIGLEGGMNLYSYAGQNPSNWIDPLGLHSFSENLDGTPVISTNTCHGNKGPLPVPFPDGHWGFETPLGGLDVKIPFKRGENIGYKYTAPASVWPAGIPGTVVKIGSSIDLDTGRVENVNIGISSPIGSGRGQLNKDGNVTGRVSPPRINFPIAPGYFNGYVGVSWDVDM